LIKKNFIEILASLASSPVSNPSSLFHESLHGSQKLYEGTTRSLGGTSRTIWYKDKSTPGHIPTIRGPEVIPVYVAAVSCCTPRVFPDCCHRLSDWTEGDYQLPVSPHQQTTQETCTYKDRLMLSPWMGG